MKNLTCLAVATLGLAALAGSAQASELVVNGGFETGSFSGWTVQAASSGSIVDVYGGFQRSGNYAAYFGAVADLDDQISQVVPTTLGTQYNVSFWINNLGSGGDHFRVSWEGGTLLDQAPIAGADSGYIQYTFVVTAASSGSNLVFSGFDGPVYCFFDDISVTAVAVPVPAASLTGLAGLAGLGVFGRRRVRA